MKHEPIDSANSKEKKVRIHVAPWSAVLSRAAIALVVLALALGPFAQAATAAPPVRENVATAVAGTFKTDCPAGSEQCTDTSLLLFVTDGAAQSCLDIYRYNPSVGLLGRDSGCAPVAAGGFAFDTKDLARAALSPTTISMQTYVCDAGLCQPSGQPENTVVAATFTGVGDIGTFRANSKSTFGSCTMYFVGKGSSRAADASVTIDGQPLDPPGFLSASTQKTKVICRLTN
jgi:hypothetical protein